MDAHAFEELNRKIDYLTDLEQIKQLQGRYQYWLCTMDYEKIADRCFAQKTPGVQIEASDSGVYKEREGVDRFCRVFMDKLRHKQGALAVHTALAPVIEIAKDGLSAKALWFSVGFGAAKGDEDLWIWGFYVIDYVKEGAEWKLWKLCFTPTFRTPYHKGWSEVPIGASLRTGLEDGPPSRWNPYDPDKTGPAELFGHLPGVPEPYDTLS
jgi:hypothetical protein